MSPTSTGGRPGTAWAAGVAVICGLALAAVLLATSRYGIGASTDSVKYMEEAQILREHGALAVASRDLPRSGYIGRFGSRGPISASSPPGYPATLATFAAPVPGLAVPVVARALNAALYALLPWLSYVAARRIGLRRSAGLLLAALAAVGPMLF
ncbi:MAG: hypothetical protein R3190_10945, partial [Thermoanaerobaculia bacterium]|nr:hypothetical protein [Thermoanaerobaculia bacterium]